MSGTFVRANPERTAQGPRVVTPRERAYIIDNLRAGYSVLSVARIVGRSSATIQRIQAEMRKADG